MKNQRKVFQSLTLILQFGLNMIVPIVMCTLLGAWLGKKYGMPIITVPLFIMGALAGFNNVFFVMMKWELGSLPAAFIGVLGLKISAYLQPLVHRFISKLGGRGDVPSDSRENEAL